MTNALSFHTIFAAIVLIGIEVQCFKPVPLILSPGKNFEAGPGKTAWSENKQKDILPTSKRRFLSAIAEKKPTKRRKYSPRIENGRELFEEAISIIQEAGLRTTALRSAQTSYAVFQTLLEVVQEVGNQRSLSNINYARTLRKLFERLGSTYIKLGQFIASSPTLFPAAYVREFQKCLDQTPTVPYAEIKRIITREIGNPDTLFASINPKPLASASIAQVHAATLKTGEEVAVKVLKPGVAETMKVDLSWLYLSSRALQVLNPDFDRIFLADTAGDVRTSMLEELDFTKEAQNIKNFQRFLQAQSLTGIATAPKVFEAYSSKQVLTMERFRGVPLIDLEGVKHYSLDPVTTLINALNTWSQSVLFCENFHADLHSGNLLVLEDGRLGFIDFGIVGKIPPKHFNGILMFGTALAKRDFQTMAKAMVSMGAADASVNTDRFAKDLENLVNSAMNSPQTPSKGASAEILVEDREVTDLLLQAIEVAEGNGLKLPREFGLVLKQIIFFDRYQNILAPGINVLADARVQGPMEALF